MTININRLSREIIDVLATYTDEISDIVFKFWIQDSFLIFGVAKRQACLVFTSNSDTGFTVNGIVILDFKRRFKTGYSYAQRR